MIQIYTLLLPFSRSEHGLYVTKLARCADRGVSIPEGPGQDCQD